MVFSKLDRKQNDLVYIGLGSGRLNAQGVARHNNMGYVM